MPDSIVAGLGPSIARVLARARGGDPVYRAEADDSDVVLVLPVTARR